MRAIFLCTTINIFLFFRKGYPFFENYKILPEHIREIVDFYMDKYDEGAYDYNDSKEFLEKMDTWIGAFKNANTTQENDRVIIPGEPELEFEKERSKNGIPIQEKVVKSLSELKKELGIDSEVF